uniref:Uncharacterized protein n=1 Tax=Spongospora subterranea TaxID=70186 RepID=A0A0H5QK77_9EUKA|eukprot:CRZ02027.1 hypothetical protein [Spongospora subterranea]
MLVFCIGVGAILCSLIKFGQTQIIDANRDSQVWAKVKMPSGNVVWQTVDSCPLVASGESGPSIFLLSPHSGDVLIGHQWFNITWKTCGFVPAVRVDLYHQLALVLTIDMATPNNEFYPWKAMLPLHYSVQAFYTIRVASLHDSNVIGESTPFRIVREYSAENIKRLHFLHEKFGGPVLDEFVVDPNI